MVQNVGEGISAVGIKRGPSIVIHRNTALLTDVGRAEEVVFTEGEAGWFQSSKYLRAKGTGRESSFKLHPLSSTGL